MWWGADTDPGGTPCGQDGKGGARGPKAAIRRSRRREPATHDGRVIAARAPASAAAGTAAAAALRRLCWAWPAAVLAKATWLPRMPCGSCGVAWTVG